MAEVRKHKEAVDSITRAIRAAMGDPVRPVPAEPQTFPAGAPQEPATPQPVVPTATTLGVVPTTTVNLGSASAYTRPLSKHTDEDDEDLD